MAHEEDEDEEERRHQRRLEKRERREQARLCPYARITFDAYAGGYTDYDKYVQHASTSKPECQKELRFKLPRKRYDLTPDEDQDTLRFDLGFHMKSGEELRALGLEKNAKHDYDNGDGGVLQYDDALKSIEEWEKAPDASTCQTRLNAGCGRFCVDFEIRRKPRSKNVIQVKLIDAWIRLGGADECYGNLYPRGNPA
tara:strand:- start:47 stop:637 length:591 start_codon:yes stop_codon:yes gene_type:complete